MAVYKGCSGRSLFCRFVLFVSVFTLLAWGQAKAAYVSQTYSFDVYTTNSSSTDASDAEANIFMRVSNADALGDEDGPPGSFGELGSSQVLFEFFVKSTAPDMSITDIYFDSDILDDLASILDGTGTDFEEDASPSAPPGGSTLTPAFNAAAVNFSSDSEPPPVSNGVDPGEIMGIIFDLESGKTIADVFLAINNGYPGVDPLPIPFLRVALHIQGFEDGESETAIVTPEPSSLALALYGFGGLSVFGFLRRRRLNSVN